MYVLARWQKQNKTWQWTYPASGQKKPNGHELHVSVFAAEV
jgi:hypothetical protein